MAEGAHLIGQLESAVAAMGPSAIQSLIQSVERTPPPAPVTLPPVAPAPVSAGGDTEF